MKKVDQINDIALMTEVLGQMVCEKSDLVWAIPFDPDLEKKIFAELFSELFISKN